MAVRGSLAVLVLENGSVFRGRSFGFESDSMGEACFNTSMSGYQEILTDPSYHRQIITMTYPMIGNYGIDPEVSESDRIYATGLIVKEYVDRPSNHTSQKTLSRFLIENRVPALDGIETRKLVLMLRNQGAQRSGIFMGEYKPQMLDMVKSQKGMEGSDLASEVTTKMPYFFGDQKNKKYRVAVLDFGVKKNILRLLDRSGFAVEVLPAGTSQEILLEKKFDCYFLSNGPGDPEPLTGPIGLVKAILAQGKPVFGICLGHQLLGLANGSRTYKLKFGHRGGNQPVKNFESGRVEITSQNHGFAVLKESEAIDRVKISHINLNDNTVEGMKDVSRNILSVQYHPEACPGPHDSEYLFQEFYKMADDYYASHAVNQ